jgi:hypothetical protein
MNEQEFIRRMRQSGVKLNDQQLKGAYRQYVKDPEPFRDLVGEGKPDPFLEGLTGKPNTGIKVTAVPSGQAKIKEKFMRDDTIEPKAERATQSSGTKTAAAPTGQTKVKQRYMQDDTIVPKEERAIQSPGNTAILPIAGQAKIKQQNIQDDTAEDAFLTGLNGYKTPAVATVNKPVYSGDTLDNSSTAKEQKAEDESLKFTQVLQNGQNPLDYALSLGSGNQQEKFVSNDITLPTGIKSIPKGTKGHYEIVRRPGETDFIYQYYFVDDTGKKWESVWWNARTVKAAINFIRKDLGINPEQDQAQTPESLFPEAKAPTGDGGTDFWNQVSHGIQIAGKQNELNQRYDSSAMSLPVNLVKEGIAAAESGIWGTPNEWGISFDPEQGLVSDKSYSQLFKDNVRESVKRGIDPFMVFGASQEDALGTAFVKFLDENPVADVIFNTIGEIAIDPMTYIDGAGLLKLMEVVKLAKLGKVDDAVKALWDVEQAVQKEAAISRRGVDAAGDLGESAAKQADAVSDADSRFLDGLGEGKAEDGLSEADIADTDIFTEGKPISDAARLSPSEQGTAGRMMKQNPKLKLKEYPTDDYDYYDANTGNASTAQKYDQMGDPGASENWRPDTFYKAIKRHTLKSNSITVIDLSYFTEEQAYEIMSYVQNNFTAELQARIVYVFD